MFEVEGYIAAIEYAKDDFFAEHGWEGRATQVDLAPLDQYVGAPILRHTLLGNIQPGDDLDAGDNCGVKIATRSQYFAKLAIETKANR